MEFNAFQKIPRLRRNWVVTEKIDGTNAQVYITDTFMPGEAIIRVGDLTLYAGSRNRWITPQDDNYGFAAWVRDNAEELVKLGPGRHFGEWWGLGIQRNYGEKQKHWSLFNTKKWHLNPDLPACCRVVPVLVSETDGFDDVTAAAEEGMYLLEKNGSYATPGYGRPEGIICYQPASGVLFKRTFEQDEKPKSLAGA